MSAAPPSPCGLVCAYQLDGQGGGTALDTSTPKRCGWLTDGTEPIWLHFDIQHQGARIWLREESGLDPVTVEVLLGRNPRPRVSTSGDRALLSLRGLSFEPSAPPEDTLSVQVWTDGRRVLTCRDRPARAIADLRRAIDHGQGPLDTGDFLSRLAERLVGPMDDLIDEEEEETHWLGHAGAQGDTGALVGELARLRRRMIRLGRYLGPQRRTLMQLASAPLGWLNADDRDLLRAAAEQTAEYADSLTSALEIAEIVQDELLQRSSEKTERRVYTLTLISAIFMPLSFITGLLGVNVAGIPDAQEPMAFLVLCIGLTVLVGLQLWMFKRKGWI